MLHIMLCQSLLCTHNGSTNPDYKCWQMLAFQWLLFLIIAYVHVQEILMHVHRTVLCELQTVTIWHLSI